MTKYISILSLRSTSATRDEAVRAFIDDGVIERCREVIPGFISGVLLQSLQDPSAACVLVEWRDQQAYEDWMVSPARGSSDPNKRLFEPSGRSHLFEAVHRVEH